MVINPKCFFLALPLIDGGARAWPFSGTVITHLSLFSSLPLWNPYFEGGPIHPALSSSVRPRSAGRPGMRDGPFRWKSHLICRCATAAACAAAEEECGRVSTKMPPRCCWRKICCGGGGGGGGGGDGVGGDVKVHTTKNEEGRKGKERGKDG